MDNRTKYAVLTMDVESFADCDCFKRCHTDLEFDMYDGLENFIELLDRNNVPSTLFVVSNTLHALRSQLRDYQKRGHRLALHGFNHTPPYQSSDEKFRQTTIWAREHIEDACGTSVIGYRAPYFGLDRSKLDILRELGFSYDSSLLNFDLAEKNCAMDLSDFKQLRRLIYEKEGFYEYKIGCHKFFGCDYPISGGAYLRLGVWSMMKHALKKHLEQSDLYIFYVHPFEMSQRKLPGFKHMSLTDRMYLNVGRMDYCNRLNEIIQMLRAEGFQFITMEDLTQKLDQEKRLTGQKVCTE